MFLQMILPGMTSAISSPESADGATPCGSPDGRTTAKSGPAPAPASLFPAPDNSAEQPTAATCGPSSTGSPESAALQSSLASRLQARLDCSGGTLYRLTWKTQVTPQGRRIFALQASAHRTSGNGSIGAASSLAGWITPSARDWKDTPGMATERPDGRTRCDQLPRQARLAGWPTPTASNGNGPRPNPLEPDFPNLQTTATLAGWCTPTATDAARGRGTVRPWDTGIPLPQQATMMQPADSGQTPNGDGAETANTGQLNPALPLWLMGLPDEYLCCAVSAMRLSPRKRRRSSKQ